MPKRMNLSRYHYSEVDAARLLQEEGQMFGGDAADIARLLTSYDFEHLRAIAKTIRKLAAGCPGPVPGT